MLVCCCLGRDLRLIEVTETICKRLLDYSLHKERTGSNRFAKVGLVLVPCPLGVGGAGLCEPKCDCWCECDLQIMSWELPPLSGPSLGLLFVLHPCRMV